MKFTNPSLSFYIFAGFLVMIYGMQPSGSHKDIGSSGTSRRSYHSSKKLNGIGSSSEGVAKQAYLDDVVKLEVNVVALNSESTFRSSPTTRTHVHYDTREHVSMSTRGSSTAPQKDLEIIAQLVYHQPRITPMELTRRCKAVMESKTGLKIPKRMDEDLMENLMAPNNVYVFAMNGNTVCGMIAGSVYGSSGIAFINYFYVAESRQSSDIAKAMKPKLIDAIDRTVEIYLLRVSANDDRSQTFFKNLGFHYMVGSHNEYGMIRKAKLIKIEVAAFDLSKFSVPLTEHDLLTGQKRDWKIIQKMLKSSPYKYIITENGFVARCAPLIPFPTFPAEEKNFWQMSRELMRSLIDPSSVFIFGMEGPFVRGMIGAVVISAAESVSIKYFYVHEIYQQTDITRKMFKALTDAVNDTVIKQITIRNGVNDEKAKNLFEAQFGFKRGDTLFTRKDLVLRLK